MTSQFGIRDGETALEQDPANMSGDGHIVFIGTISSPWKRREDCPKNIRQARERQQTATVTVDAPYRKGLQGLEAGSRIILVSWLNRSPRNIIVQKPRHRDDPIGTFSLRSPVRPNPLGLHTVEIVAIDHKTGSIEIDAIDTLDGTPIVDIKPHIPAVDRFPDQDEKVA